MITINLCVIILWQEMRMKLYLTVWGRYLCSLLAIARKRENAQRPAQRRTHNETLHLVRVFLHSFALIHSFMHHVPSTSTGRRGQAHLTGE